MPPVALVLGAAGSVQFGAALATTLFDRLGPGGTVLLRVAFAAALLLAVWRPRPRHASPADRLLVVGFGLSLAGMNGLFYAALQRIPLGVAVTVEFAGPLAVALAGSRRRLDIVWALLAALGIVGLSDRAGHGTDLLGVVLALGAGAFWALYIVLNARAGRAFSGGRGLALAMAVAALVLIPVGVAQAGAALLSPPALAIGAAVAMLSSAIPYSLELEALRRLPAHVFGVLMSLEPAVAALAGFVVLGQRLRPAALAAIGLVVLASAGATRGARQPPAP